MEKVLQCKSHEQHPFTYLYSLYMYAGIWMTTSSDCLCYHQLLAACHRLMIVVAVSYIICVGVNIMAGCWKYFWLWSGLKLKMARPKSKYWVKIFNVFALTPEKLRIAATKKKNCDNIPYIHKLQINEPEPYEGKRATTNNKQKVLIICVNNNADGENKVIERDKNSSISCACLLDSP